MKIPVSEPDLDESELNNVIQAIKSTWISSRGEFIEKFEKDFAQYCGVKCGISAANGTAALHLALLALGIGNDDEVIVPTLTYIATANVVKYCGAKPVFVDSTSDYWCMNPEKIAEKITEKTKAIIPVHIYGHPCDMDAIRDIASDYELVVIEDAAEAHGAEYHGKKVGSLSDIACFSFFGNKVITTGEGGMCITDNEEFAERIKLLRNQGMNPIKKYWHTAIGYNYRMTNIQAAIGSAQLLKINKFLQKKREIARAYSIGLKDLEEKGLIKLHPEMPWAKCIYWMYSILLTEKCSASRDELMVKLQENGIETRPFFYPVHTMKPFLSNEKFEIAEKLASSGINLPSSTKLKSEDAIYVIETLRDLIRPK